MRLSVLVPLTGMAVATLLAGCSLTPAEEDPVQIRLGDLDARVAKVERIIANQSLVELSQRVFKLNQANRGRVTQRNVHKNRQNILLEKSWIELVG